MCGGYPLTPPPAVIAQTLQLEEPPFLTPRYHIAPSPSIAVIRLNPNSATREGVRLGWGLIPSWASDPTIGNQCINAKAETVAEQPAFRSSFAKRRCLLMADGFYEWHRQGRRKQPM